MRKLQSSGSLFLNSDGNGTYGIRCSSKKSSFRASDVITNLDEIGSKQRFPSSERTSPTSYTIVKTHRNKFDEDVNLILD